jgi:micrococcal nuclease
MQRTEKPMKLFIIVFILIYVMAFSVAVANCQTYTGAVVFVQDGDSVTFRTSGGKYIKTRLSGVDTPETRQTFGVECKQQMKNLTFGIPATIIVEGTDVYRRKLVKLSTASFADISLRLLQIGCAWEYGAPLDRKTAYQNAEQTARQNNVGLWIDASAKSPWAFRSGCP